ncbi:hypothetical protein QBC32DRAFT_207896, partial [Pseudoneurospora amorphoporcata]
AYHIHYSISIWTCISMILLYHGPSIWPFQPATRLRRFPGEAATQIVNRQPHPWSRPVVSV